MVFVNGFKLFIRSFFRLGCLVIPLLFLGALVGKPVQALEPGLVFEQLKAPTYVAYIAKVSKGHAYQVVPAVSDGLLSLGQFVEQYQPDVAINGGYFDPNNKKTVSHLQVKDDTWNPANNERLTQNPALASYLPTIFNRTEFRTYSCLKGPKPYTAYAIANHQQSDAVSPKSECELVGVLGAGPRLLPEATTEAEAFWAKNAQGKVTRDPLGVAAKNARSAVGLTKTGDVIILMVSQLKDAPRGSGVTLNTLQTLLKQSGAVAAMALDGGSSSGFYGLVSSGGPGLVYGKWQQAAKANSTATAAPASPVVRPLKSILMVTHTVSTPSDGAFCGRIPVVTQDKCGLKH